MKISNLSQTQEEKLFQQETIFSTQKKMDILEQIKLKLEEQSKPLIINLKCEKCGKIYQKPIYELRKSIKRGYVHYYCSKECSCKTNASNQKITKYCLVCKKEIKKRNNLYCSKICRAKAREHMENIICPICSKEFRPHSTRTIYCSMKCKNKAHSERMKGKNNSNYKNGETTQETFNQKMLSFSQNLMQTFA